MPLNSELQDFIHPNLGQEITAIGGHYVFNNERRLSFDGRDVLYLVGYAVVDTSCCGVGGCAYAMVPGVVKKWKFKKLSFKSDVKHWGGMTWIMRKKLTGEKAYTNVDSLVDEREEKIKVIKDIIQSENY